MSDQHTASIMGCASDPLVHTPHLDRLSDEGVRMDAAYCSFPLCCPSRMSFLTGRFASEIDCFDNRVQLSSDIPTFAHAFCVSGYETVLAGRMHIVGPDQWHGFERRILSDVTGTAYANAGHAPGILEPLAHAMGGSRAGFEHSGPGRSGLQAFDDRVSEVSVRWLRQRGQEASGRRPFVMVVGYFLPHNPWIAPAEDFARYDGKITERDLPHLGHEPPHPLHRGIRQRAGWNQIDIESQIRVRTAYYAMCTTMDRHVGRVLEALHDAGLAEDTLVVYTSDHGEALGAHGLWGKSTFFEESARIPLILRWPGRIAAGSTVAQPVSLMDLGPTLLDLAGATPLPVATAVSFAPLLLRPDAPHAAYPDAVISELETGRMIRRGRWKYCHYVDMPDELYDLESDPQEMTNLAGTSDHAGQCRDLRTRLMAGWDPDRARQTIARREKELPLIADWIRTAAPPEPIPMWHDGPQENRVDRPPPRS